MDAIWIAVGVIGALLLVILLVRLGRSGERVIDSGPGPVAAVAEPEAAAAAPTARGISSGDAGGPGEVLEARGVSDAECGLADWLMDDINRTLGVDLTSDQMVINRVADAALQVSADLKATGRAAINLPYLTADARGPQHYQREIAVNEAELGMLHHGVLLVDELLQWRGRDARTMALGAWLEAEAEEDSGHSFDAASSLRLADAAEQAMAAIASTGSAVVDLPGLVDQKGGTLNFRREFDRAELDDMIGGSQ